MKRHPKLPPAFLTLGGAMLASLALAQAPTDKKEAPDQVDPDQAKTVWEYLASRYDADKDGTITREEYTRGDEQFKRLDRDGNGSIEAADMKIRAERRGRGGGRSRVQPPQEGAAAPDFKLETLYPAPKTEEGAKGEKDDGAKGKKQEDAPVYETIQLSSLKDKKPVALIFGSYT